MIGGIFALYPLRLPEGPYGLIWAFSFLSFRWALPSIRKLFVNSLIIFSLLFFVAFPASYLFFPFYYLFSVELLENVEKLKWRVTFVLYFVASNRLLLNYSAIKIIILENLHFTFTVKFFLFSFFSILQHKQLFLLVSTLNRINYFYFKCKKKHFMTNFNIAIITLKNVALFVLKKIYTFFFLCYN